MSDKYTVVVKFKENRSSGLNTVAYFTDGLSAFQEKLRPWVINNLTNISYSFDKKDKLNIGNVNLKMMDKNGQLDTYLDAETVIQRGSGAWDYRNMYFSIYCIPSTYKSFNDLFQILTIGMTGSSGSGDGQFNDPSGVTVDSNGNIYVADSCNDRIQKFTSAGVYSAKVGSSGTGDGQFNAPTGMAIDSNNNIWVVDRSNHRVSKYNSSLLPQGWFGKGSVSTGWHANGSGETSGNLGSGDGEFGYPEDCWVQIESDTFEYIFITDGLGHRVQKFRIDAGSESFILKWGSSGSGDGQFNIIAGICGDSNDNIYVVDTGNQDVQKFQKDGTFSLKWGSYGSNNAEFDSPVGIAIDSNNKVYISEGNFASQKQIKIQKFDSSGNYLSSFGSYGNGIGQFSAMKYLWIDSDCLFVPDTARADVQKFDLSESEDKYLFYTGRLKTRSDTRSYANFITEPIEKYLFNEKVVQNKSTFDSNISMIPLHLNTRDEKGRRISVLSNDDFQFNFFGFGSNSTYVCIGTDGADQDHHIDCIWKNGIKVSETGISGGWYGDATFRWQYDDTGTNNGRWAKFEYFDGSWKIVDNDWLNSNRLFISIRSNGTGSASKYTPPLPRPANYINYLLRTFTDFYPDQSWITQPNIDFGITGSNFTINVALSFCTYDEKITVGKIIDIICISCGGIFWIDRKGAPDMIVYHGASSINHYLVGTNNADKYKGKYKRDILAGDIPTYCLLTDPFCHNEKTKFTNMEGHPGADNVLECFIYNPDNQTEIKAVYDNHAALYGVKISGLTFPMFRTAIGDKINGVNSQYYEWDIGQIVSIVDLSPKSISITSLISGVKYNLKNKQVTFKYERWAS